MYKTLRLNSCILLCPMEKCYINFSPLLYIGEFKMMATLLVIYNDALGSRSVGILNLGWTQITWSRHCPFLSMPNLLGQHKDHPMNNVLPRYIDSILSRLIYSVLSR